jgi:hypothetical protein
MQIFDLFGDISIRGDNQVNNSLNKIGDTLTNIGGKMMKFGGVLTAGVTLPIIGLIGKSTMLASDLSESFNVVNVTFGKNADEVTDWSKTLLDKYGLVQLESMKYVGSMGAMLKSSGLTTKASQEMSQSLVELTGDVSSFYNLSHEESWEKIRSGIAGETEPLKALGINMSVANMEAFALQQGIKKAWKEMSQSEQIMLRYQYLMDVTADSQGDFARTSDGFANQLRILEGRFTEIGTKIGEKVLPIINDFTKIIVNLIEKFQKLDPKIQDFIFYGGLIVATIGPLIAILGGIVTGFGMFLGAITAIASPILIVSGLIAGLVTVVGLLTGGIIGLTLKSGKIDELKESFKKFSDVITPIPELIYAIFTNDHDKMMDLLINKFNLSKEETFKFIEKVQELRDKFGELADKIGTKVVNKLKELFDKIYENRHEIGQFLDKVIDLGINLVDIADEKGPDFIQFCKDTVEALKPVVTWLKDVVDWTLEAIDGLAKVSNKETEVKQKREGIGGFFKDIFSLPGSASGSMNFGGGLTWMDERGPELVSLPPGSRIHTAAESMSMMSRTSNNSSNNVYNFNVTLDAKNVRDFNNAVDFIDNIKVEAIARGSS